MSAPRHRLTSPPQGFSLVELMVGMVIGLLLLFVVSSVFLSQRASNNTQGDLGSIQENARGISQLLQREVRLAGYSDATLLNTFGAKEIMNATNDMGANTSDALTVRFFGASRPATTTADGTVSNCLGVATAGDVLSEDTFTITNDPAGRPWLSCNDTPLFPGVESFQVLLGEDTDGDLAINRYVPAGAATMANVRAVLISVVLRGETLTNPTPDSLAINHFGSSYAPANVAPAGDAGSMVLIPSDGRLRRHFSFYIAMRNRLN
jgi:type IV pilus assembly protein PilW